MTQWPIVIPAQLVKGTLKFNAARLHAALRGRKDGDVNLVIEKPKRRISDVQRGYYWAVVIPILAEYTGYTPDEIHDFCKRRFLPKLLAVTNQNGEILSEEVIGGSTEILTPLEYADYTTRIAQWALDELQVVIPPPDQNWRESLLSPTAEVMEDSL